MQSKVVLLTGATGQIGEAIAQKIASFPNYHLTLLGRDESKCIALQTRLQSVTNNPNIDYAIVDLSLYSSVKSFAQQYKNSGKRLDVLINNAAVVSPELQKTGEGIELQWAVNVMSYFWMIRELKDVLISSAPSRVVNVASNYAGSMDLNDLQFQRRKYNANTVYQQSKQANRMISAAFAEELKNHQVSVNACHPGVVTSPLLSNLGMKSGYDSAGKGAETPVMLATEDIGQTYTGKYYSYLKESKCNYSENKDQVKQLFNYCESLTQSLPQE